jgi:hypothetical protein
MNSTAWLQYFQNNRLNRPEPKWHLPFPEDHRTASQLARSLSHFQLGESGEGTFLLNAAQSRYSDDPDYEAALALFIAEEQEHARLLARLVERFGGSLIRRHWTHSLFRLFRHALGVRFEIQVLVTAELIGTAYYRVLARRVRDSVAEHVCQLVLRDEAQHVAFHLDRFATDQERWLPIERALWAAQFQTLFLAAAKIAWLDHRAALGSLGATEREFLSDARAEAASFITQLIAPLQVPNWLIPAP